MSRKRGEKKQKSLTGIIGRWTMMIALLAALVLLGQYALSAHKRKARGNG